MRAHSRSLDQGHKGAPVPQNMYDNVIYEDLPTDHRRGSDNSGGGFRGSDHSGGFIGGSEQSGALRGSNQSILVYRVQSDRLTDANHLL